MPKSFGSAYLPITIPSNQVFLTQWHPWIHGKVLRHFKRDKERVLDTAQNVRLRLLSKDFIGRWFFKHLREELVDKSQAEHILGNRFNITFVGALKPVDNINWSCLHSQLEKHQLTPNELNSISQWVYDGKPIEQHPIVSKFNANDIDTLAKNKCIKNFGRKEGCVRACQHSLWSVEQILDFARFDYERYYYSIQNHTIDSDKVLRLLGQEPGEYSFLQSMQRQGKLLPSELTGHSCKRKGATGTSPKSCPGCVQGLASLKSRGLTLASDWTSKELFEKARQLRWNDSQLASFLRGWQNTNHIYNPPQYIMRTSLKPGINAGLLKYAEKIIDHEVYNDFKRMRRTDDLPTSILNGSVSPEYQDSEIVAWEGGDKGTDQESYGDMVIRDVNSSKQFSKFEDNHDLTRLLSASDLNEEEASIIQNVDLNDTPISDYSEKVGSSIPRVHRVRTAALKKLRESDGLGVDIHSLAQDIASKFGCDASDIFSKKTFGLCVLARSEFFASLHSIYDIPIRVLSQKFGMDEDRISSAIYRAQIRENRASGT